MREELVLSLRHVTSGYREGGIFGRKTYQEVLHDVTFDVRHGEIFRYRIHRPTLKSRRDVHQM